MLIVFFWSKRRVPAKHNRQIRHDRISVLLFAVVLPSWHDDPILCLSARFSYG